MANSGEEKRRMEAAEQRLREAQRDLDREKMHYAEALEREARDAERRAREARS